MLKLCEEYAGDMFDYTLNMPTVYREELSVCPTQFLSKRMNKNVIECNVLYSHLTQSLFVLFVCPGLIIAWSESAKLSGQQKVYKFCVTDNWIKSHICATNSCRCLVKTFEILPLPYKYTFSLINFIVNSHQTPEIFQLCIVSITVIHRINSSFTDQLTNFHVFRKQCVGLSVCLFVHSFSHTCNSGHINYRLQFIYYNITYNIWTSTYYNITNNTQNLKNNWKCYLSLQIGICVYCCTVHFVDSIIITQPTNALIVCNLFLNHFFKTLSLLLHVSIAYCLSSSGSTYSS